MAHVIRESGMKTLTKEMEKDIRFGQMDLYTKDTGRMIKPMVVVV